MKEIPCGWISQLKVCQLLAASPQVVYPIGLNGHEEPIITTLPDQKVPPFSKVSTILITSPHKSPPKSEGSVTMEVSNLLSQAVLEASSCESKHSLPREPTASAVLWTPPQKPEGPLQAVDTSPQVTIKEADASLEDIPSNISPIAAVSRSGSISTSVDLAELQTNANRALDDLLNNKGSIDARRWRAVWELGVILHQNESQVATSIKEAKVICSQVTLDYRTACFQLILEEKTDFLAAVKKAKTTRGHLVQEAKAACSRAICEAKAQKVSWAATFHKEHGNYT